MNNLRSNLPALYDFYIVAKSKSFSKAAEIYNIPQPSLSRNVKILEDELKKNLINRSNKGINLTNFGEELFEKLDEMFSNFNEYNNTLSETKNLNGKLIIGTTRNIADNKLSIYLSLFNKQYPNVRIKILTDSASNLNSYLLDHKIDVLIDYVPNINFSEKDNMIMEVIGSFNTCFACSKDFYNKYSSKIKKVTDLKNYNLVIPGASRRRQMLNEVLAFENIKLMPTIEMPDSKLMADFVKNNEYIGYFIKEEVEEYGLVPLKLDVKMPQNCIGMIYPKNTISLIAKKFIDIVLNNMNI